MNNPWLKIPLEDYEGHMAMPDVGQAKMLANEFEELLITYAPTSAALIGCAGGPTALKRTPRQASRALSVSI
jgi:hypothetical protein